MGVQKKLKTTELRGDKRRSFSLWLLKGERPLSSQCVKRADFVFFCVCAWPEDDPKGVETHIFIKKKNLKRNSGWGIFLNGGWTEVRYHKGRQRFYPPTVGVGPGVGLCIYWLFVSGSVPLSKPQPYVLVLWLSLIRYNCFSSVFINQNRSECYFQCNASKWHHHLHISLIYLVD